MRVVLVGAGSVGQAYGYHFQRGGAEVVYVVRPHHVERLRRGLALYPWNRRDRTTPVHWSDYALATSVDEALAEPADVIALCTSSTALLGGDWFDRVAALRGDAAVLALNVGTDVPDYIFARVPQSSVVWGLISLASWPAPLEGQDLPEPGNAWWVPWGGRLPFSGDGAVDVAAVLAQGGMPTRVVGDVLETVAFSGVLLSMISTPLAIAGWSMRNLAADRELIHLARRSMLEAWAYAEKTTGTRTPLALRALTPSMMRFVIRRIFPLAPVDFEVFFRFHYTKIADQVSELLTQRIVAIRAAGMSAAALTELRGRLWASRRALTPTTDRASLVPFGDADIDELLAMFQQPAMRRFLLDDGLVDRGWVEAEVAASRKRFEDGALGLWSVRVGGEIAGFVGFRPFFDPPQLQLLYGLAEGFTGQGLATEVAAEAMRQLRQRGHTRIRASIDAPNGASQRVLERLGFREVGREPSEPHETVHFVWESAEGMRPG